MLASSPTSQDVCLSQCGTQMPDLLPSPSFSGFPVSSSPSGRLCAAHPLSMSLDGLQKESPPWLHFFVAWCWRRVEARPCHSGFKPQFHNSEAT